MVVVVVTRGSVVGTVEEEVLEEIVGVVMGVVVVKWRPASLHWTSWKMKERGRDVKGCGVCFDFLMFDFDFLLFLHDVAVARGLTSSR